MLSRVIIYGLVSLVILLGGYAFYQSRANKSLEVEVKNGEDAIVAYEQLLKIAPRDAVNKERKEMADEKINAIITDSNSISDDTYKL